MKTFAKGLAALLICGAIISVNFDKAEAAEVADVTINSVETENLARHFPPPPPPPRHRHRHHPPFGFHEPPPYHHDKFREPPPPPLPHRHGGHHRPHPHR